MEQKIKKSLNFIIDNYSPLEVTKAYEYNDIECKDIYKEVDLLFPLGFVLSSMHYLPESMNDTKIEEWIEEAKNLLKQEGSNYTYNYWVHKSDGDENQKLPDDVDDTASCLIPLLLHGEPTDPKTFIKTIELETATGGPYNTWYLKVDENSRWYDIDPVVNAHFLALCGLNGIDLPNTLEYVLKKFDEGDFGSKYYPYDLIFVLYLSKYAKFSNDRSTREILLNYLGNLDTDSLSDLELLLFGLSTKYLDENVEKPVHQKILNLQQNDGSVISLPMCYGFNKRKDVQTHAGNKANSTALLLEYMCMNFVDKQQKDRKSNDPIQKLQEEVFASITENMKDKYYYNELNEVFPFKENLKCTYYPLSIFFDLNIPKTQKNIEIISQLCEMSFYLWAGYTVEDKIYDKEISTSFINVASDLKLVGLEILFESNDIKQKYKKIIKQSLYDQNIFHNWESKNANFDLENIKEAADKFTSIDYIVERMNAFITFSSIIPEIFQVKDIDSKDIKFIVKSIFLIDQLNDDAHDWEEDLKNKIMTFTLSNIVRLAENPNDYKDIFWLQVMTKINNMCQEYYNSSYKIIQKLKLEEGYINKILNKSIKPIRDAIKEVNNVERILDSV